MGRKSQSSATSGKAAIDNVGASGEVAKSDEVIAAIRPGRPPSIINDTPKMVPQSPTAQINGQVNYAAETDASPKPIVQSVTAAPRFEINQRPRRQIKHKYIKSTSYAPPFIETHPAIAPAPPIVNEELSPAASSPIVIVVGPSELHGATTTTKPVRRRGRPRKDTLVTPIALSPVTIDDNSSTSNPSLQLVEIINDEADVQVVEEVEICTMADEVEQYELMLVEDVDQSETEMVNHAEDSSLSDPGQIIVHQESDDTYVVTVENGDDSHQPEVYEVFDSLDSELKLSSARIVVDDSTSQNSTLNSLSGGETELVYGFDGDQPVCKPREPSFNGAFSGIRKTKRTDSPTVNGHKSPANATKKPSAVEIAVQQLTMLGVSCTKGAAARSDTRKRRDGGELSLGFLSEVSGMFEDADHDHTKKTHKKKATPTLENLVKRATRKNSIVNLPSKARALEFIRMTDEHFQDANDSASREDVEVSLQLTSEPVVRKLAEKNAKAKHLTLKDKMQTNIDELFNKSDHKSSPNVIAESEILHKSRKSESPKKKKQVKPLDDAPLNGTDNSTKDTSIEQKDLNNSPSITKSSILNIQAPNPLPDNTELTVPDDILNNIKHKKYRRNVSTTTIVVNQPETPPSANVPQPEVVPTDDAKPSESTISHSAEPTNVNVESEKKSDKRKSEKSHKKHSSTAAENQDHKHRSHGSERRTEPADSSTSRKSSSKSSTKSVPSPKSTKSTQPATTPNDTPTKSESSKTKSTSHSKENKSHKAADNHKTDPKPESAHKKVKSSFAEAVKAMDEISEKKVESKRTSLEDPKKKQRLEESQLKKRSRWDTSSESSTSKTVTATKPVKKMDSYSILSDCYLPKMVKHDASLYSIEAMRAAELQREIEAKELAEAKKAAERKKIEEAAAVEEAKRMAEAMKIVEAMRLMEQKPEIETRFANVVSPVLPDLPDISKSPVVSKGMLKCFDNGSPVLPNSVKLEPDLDRSKVKTEQFEVKLESPTAKDDSTEEETNIRRSGRIKIISETKQRSQGYGLVRDRERFHGSMDVSFNSSQEFLDSDTSSSCLGYVSDLERDASLIRCESGGKVKTLEEMEKEQKDVKEGLGLFEQIIDNEFKSERIISKEAKRMTCDCFLTAAEIERGEFGCGEDCLNRLLMIECGSRCVVGQRCTNKRFQKHQNSDCTIFKTEKKGFGLSANSFIAAGDFIMEYVGEVLNSQQFEHRANEYSLDQNKHYYFMALRSDCVIDATARGNISRFINHSCDPNAETQKWTVNGELRIGFFSTKDILPGQEITFDYQFQRYGKEAQRCYCEAECCRGWIGEEPESDEEAEENELGDDEGIEKDLTRKPESAEDVGQTLPLPQDQLSDENVLITSAPTSSLDVPSEADASAQDAALKPLQEPVQVRKPKMHKKHIIKRSEIMEDPDLDKDIEILTKSNLKNQTQTLRFSRLMVRAKLRKAKSQLLSILRCGELACRRLFLDYHGLKLIYTWMCDPISTDMRIEWEFRLEILQTLDVLPILNKLMLQDSKVFSTVLKWAGLADTGSTKSSPEESSSPSDTQPSAAISTANIGDCDIPKLIEQNSIIKDIGLDALKQIIDTNQSNAKKIINASAAECDYPELMEEIYRLSIKLTTQWDTLPEVFRIPKKLRIEQMKEHEREANRNYRALGLADETETPKHPQLSDRFRERDKDPEKERVSRDTRFRYQRPEFQHPSEVNLCKFQRRKLFEAKVAAEKEKAMQRLIHSSKCTFFRLDDRRVQEHEMPFCVNPFTGQWYGHAGNKIPTPPSHLHIKPPQKKQSVNPDDYHLPPLDLPEHWKFGIDSAGRLYYYHVKIRIPQWEPPIKLLPLSNDPTATTAPGQPVADQRSESEESSDTESEDSSEDELQNKLSQIKKIKGKQRSLEAMMEQPTNLDDEISAMASTGDGDAATSMMNLAMQIESIVPQKRKKCRKSLVQEHVISPRTDEELYELRMEMRRYKEKKMRRQSDEYKRKRLGQSDGADSGGPQRKVSKLMQGLPIVVDDNADNDDIAMELDRLPVVLSEASRLAAAVEEEASAQDSPIIGLMGMSGRCVDELDTLQKPMREKLRQQASAAERSHKRPHKKPVPAPVSDDVAKRIKEKFQREIAVEIVHFLSYYRRDACTIGRITSDDDFRHLAKKLSHFVMLKELKHCDNTVVELEVTESVKSKAKDYIRNYMTKFGSVYTKSSTDSKSKDTRPQAPASTEEP